MKRHSIYPLSLLVSAALLPACASAAAKISPVLLRYAFAPGRTNAYSVQIESQGDAGREVIGGTLIVSARAAGSN